MKKALIVFLIFAMSFSMTACSSKVSEENDSTKGTTSPVVADSVVETERQPDSADTPEDNELDQIESIVYPRVDEIDFYFADGLMYGEPAASFGYVNNSNHTIVSILLSFSIREDFTEDKMAAFDSLVEAGRLDAEEIPGLKPYVNCYMVCDPGEKVEGSSCVLSGSCEATSADQCEGFRLENAKIRYLGIDGSIHTVAYTAEEDSYTLLDSMEPIKMWSDKNIAQSIPVPDTRFIAVNHDNDDYFQFTAYDMSHEEFRIYCEECQAAGFTNDLENSEYSFWCTNNDGLTLHIRYFQHMNAMELSTH